MRAAQRLVYGGGLKMGQVIGETDTRAERSTSGKISFQNIIATIYHVLGVDPSDKILDFNGRPQYVQLDDTAADLRIDGMSIVRAAVVFPVASFRQNGVCFPIVPDRFLAVLQSNAVQPLRRAEPLDRQVAEWVILSGGSVSVAGRAQRIGEVTQLPAGDIHLTLVDLVGSNILPPDMQWLIGLKYLKVLTVPGPMWNPSSGARIDYSRELRHLAGIKTLEALTFSNTYLEEIKFQDDGVEEIVPLAPSLKVLSLENTSVRGRHLAHFTNLEALDLVYCPVDDKGMKELQGLDLAGEAVAVRRS